MIEFTVFGNPIAKARARAAMTRRGVRFYTPSKTGSAQKSIAIEAWIAMKALAKSKFTGPVAVRLNFFVLVPKSWSTKKKAEAIYNRTRPAGKPDLDNLIKTVFDGCNGVLWVDDAQVVSIEATKDYCETPRTIVSVWGV